MVINDKSTKIVIFIALGILLFTVCMLSQRSKAEVVPSENVLQELVKKVDALSSSLKQLRAKDLHTKMDKILGNQANILEELQQLKRRVSSR